MLGAEVGDALDVALGRRVHAAGADHGLAEEGGDVLGADALDLRLQRGQRVEGHRGDGGDQRAPVARVGLDAADARAEAVRAVVALRAADQVHPLGLALLDPVAAGDLGRRVDRVAAARGEEDPRAVHRRVRGEPLATARSPGGCRSRRRSSRPPAGPSARRRARRPRGCRGRCWRTRGSRCRRGSGGRRRRRPTPPPRARSAARAGRRPPCRRTGARSGTWRWWVWQPCRAPYRRSRCPERPKSAIRRFRSGEPRAQRARDLVDRAAGELRDREPAPEAVDRARRSGGTRPRRRPRAAPRSRPRPRRAAGRSRRSARTRAASPRGPSARSGDASGSSPSEPSR